MRANATSASSFESSTMTSNSTRGGGGNKGKLSFSWRAARAPDTHAETARNEEPRGISNLPAWMTRGPCAQDGSSVLKAQATRAPAAPMAANAIATRFEGAQVGDGAVAGGELVRPPSVRG